MALTSIVAMALYQFVSWYSKDGPFCFGTGRALSEEGCRRIPVGGGYLREMLVSNYHHVFQLLEILWNSKLDFTRAYELGFVLRAVRPGW